MNTVDAARGMELLDAVDAAADALSLRVKGMSLLRRRLQRAADPALTAAVASAVEYLADSDDKRLVAALNGYPFRPGSRHLAAVGAATAAIRERLQKTANRHTPQ